jgi:hypothetical protein
MEQCQGMERPGKLGPSVGNALSLAFLDCGPNGHRNIVTQVRKGFARRNLPDKEGRDRLQKDRPGDLLGYLRLQNGVKKMVKIDAGIRCGATYRVEFLRGSPKAESQQGPAPC